MTIEGLGKKFQEARIARNLTLDEAARMTKIRPSRLAEIEADDFSQFPSLAYAKGFLLIYGKFLEVDVTPYMEVFETSEHVTVDGYSYLQDNPAPKPVRAPVVRRRASAAPSVSSSGERTSLMPMIIGIVVIGIGIFLTKFVLELQRIGTRKADQQALARTAASTPAVPTPVAVAPQPTPAPSAKIVAATPPVVVASVAPSATPAAVVAHASASVAPPAKVAAASATPSAPSPAGSEPEVRRAEPVKAEEVAKTGSSPAAEVAGENKIAIRPLKKTYIKVIVDNEAKTPAYERWISPSDGTVEFHGQHVNVRVLDREAIQIKKNGKALADGDSDVTIE
jgi:cytoskeletal protein RodZ